MKYKYEKPIMFIEEFVANEAVSACTVQNNGISYTFDCMRGKDTDTESIFNTDLVEGTCKNVVGYQKNATTAINNDTDSGHSNNVSSSGSSAGITADWTGGTSSYTKVVYSGTFEGLLYLNGGNGSFNTRNWTYDNLVTITHADADGEDGQHIMVAPLVSLTSVNASW